MSSWISTRGSAPAVGLRQAVQMSLAPDGGLYMPARLTPLSPQFFAELRQQTLPETAAAVLGHLMGDELAPAVVSQLAARAFTFPAPLRRVDDDTAILELFHGPSQAFKDFAAQWMAQLLGYWHELDRSLGVTAPAPTVLVATSGDTGGAVAAAFAPLHDVHVVILYPKGRVSPLQERQLTTWGSRVRALAVDGTFDDCQRLVKQAFGDADLRRAVSLVSCNSINIARWMPQAIYYFEAYKQCATDRPLVISVPSGNFGNLAAGVLAQRLGLPVHRFLAATNQNDAIPRYLHTGSFEPRPTIATLSNAMDVGHPSNAERLFALYRDDLAAMQRDIVGYAVDDDQTRATMRQVYQQHGLVLDPHTSVAYRAWQQFRVAAHSEAVADSVGQHVQSRRYGVVLATAHPAKFQADVEAAIGGPVPLPEAMAELWQRPRQVCELANDYLALVRVLHGS